MQNSLKFSFKLHGETTNKQLTIQLTRAFIIRFYSPQAARVLFAQQVNAPALQLLGAVFNSQSKQTFFFFLALLTFLAATFFPCSFCFLNTSLFS